MINTIQNTIQNTIRSTLGDDAFNILDLFTGGQQGVWYDPSDLATMYQESTGATPVTADGQPVGLMLDKSRGDLFGDELVTNGTFDTDSDWILGAGWTISDGVANANTTGNWVQITTQNMPPLVVGRSYLLKYTLVRSVGYLSYALGGASNATGVNSSGDYEHIIVATSTEWLKFRGVYNFVGSIDNVSVKEVLGTHASQPVATQRPTYNDNPDRLTLDLVDDSLAFTVPTGGWDGYMVVGTDQGTASYGVSLPAGDYALGGAYFFGDTINGVAIFEGDVSDSDLKKVEAEFVKNGAKASYGDVTTFQNFWNGKSEITEFPLIDTSSGTNFNFAWFGNNLTSFPLIDTSNGVYFGQTWRFNNLTSFPKLDFSSSLSFFIAWSDNPNLVDFPANMFDNCDAVNFYNAFVGTNLSQESIDNILVSIASNGTSNGTFGQSGGNAPSAVGEAAIDALVTRGWTVNVTGGYQGKILPAGLFDNDENGFWYSMDIGA